MSHNVWVSHLMMSSCVVVLMASFGTCRAGDWEKHKNGAHAEAKNARPENSQG